MCVKNSFKIKIINGNEINTLRPIFVRLIGDSSLRDKSAKIANLYRKRNDHV